MSLSPCRHPVEIAIVCLFECVDRTPAVAATAARAKQSGTNKNDR